MNMNGLDLIFMALPMLHVLAAALPRLQPPAAAWRSLQAMHVLGLGFSATLVASVAAGAAPLSGLFMTGWPSLIVLLLVGFISLVVTRYSSSYLRSEPREGRFQSYLQLTVACVLLVVSSNHLLVLLAAWTGISLALHQLLMFYPERKRAALAAHKKFIFARLAELCIAGAAVLLYLQHGTFLLTEIMGSYSAASAGTLSLAEQIAAVLLVCAALVKCAQLPLHGWLIQVVEAPTPVSALLHAGIVNLGGYLMIISAPLLMAAAPARWLLLVVAGLSCILAALVMTTRVSIKVMLAWSTVAQMGLMLLECALGQFGLALLHLVAHSCYKAYAFLGSGSQVEYYLRSQLAGAAPGRARGMLFGVLALAAVAGGAFMTLPTLPGELALWMLFGLMLSVLVAEADRAGWGGLSAVIGLSAGLSMAYLAQKFLFAQVAPAFATPGVSALVFSALLFAVLLLSHALLRYWPQSALAQRLHRNLFAGFYLDEWATRATLALWPARLPHVQLRLPATAPTTHAEVAL